MSTQPDVEARRLLAILGLIGAAILALLAVVPWLDFQNHSHWGRITWVPFSPPIRPRDLIANLLLFAPVGALSPPVFRRPLSTALLLILALSLAGEFSQIYSHTRFPSATDLACNVLGGVAAAALVQRWRSATSPRNAH